MCLLITFERLTSNAAGRKLPMGASIGKAREEAEARSQRVFWDNPCVY